MVALRHNRARSCRNHRWWLILPLILLLLAADFHPAEAQSRKRRRKRPAAAKTLSIVELRLRIYIDWVAAPLDPRITNALRRIPATPRRLLALKYYLGRLPEVDSIWAWTAAQARAYRTTDEYRQAIAEVTHVRHVFDSLYPGYTLLAPMEIRSLEAQLRNWNSVRSVAVVADSLFDSCIAMMADTTSPFGRSDTIHAALFGDFLAAWETPVAPTVAVPGLSQHGQLRAFEFRNYRGRRLISGATAATIERAWDSSGWTAKLNAAITLASSRFVGPLPNPYEPWHYTYIPANPLQIEDVAKPEPQGETPSPTPFTPKGIPQGEDE